MQAQQRLERHPVRVGVLLHRRPIERRQRGEDCGEQKEHKHTHSSPTHCKLVAASSNACAEKNESALPPSSYFIFLTPQLPLRHQLYLSRSVSALKRLSPKRRPSRR